MIGGILFLIAVLIIGVINDRGGMAIPINLRIAENIWRSVFLVIFIGFSVAGLWWKAETPRHPSRRTPLPGFRMRE